VLKHSIQAADQLRAYFRLRDFLPVCKKEQGQRRKLQDDGKEDEGGDGFLVQQTHRCTAKKPCDSECAGKETEGGASLIGRGGSFAKASIDNNSINASE
jgi:hypothetical protein